MKMKNRVKFIYFDVGGVILRWRKVLYNIAEIHNKAFSDVEAVFSKHDTIAGKGVISAQQMWERMCKDLDIVERKVTDFAMLNMQSFTPITETHELLHNLVKIIPLGIITNAYLGFFNLGIKHGHVPDIPYSVVIESCNIGMIKPQPEIFAHAQKAAKVSANHILFVDDYKENILAARAMGWRALLFDTENPEKSIRKIRELIA